MYVCVVFELFLYIYWPAYVSAFKYIVWIRFSYIFVRSTRTILAERKQHTFCMEPAFPTNYVKLSRQFRFSDVPLIGWISNDDYVR